MIVWLASWDTCCDFVELQRMGGYVERASEMGCSAQCWGEVVEIYEYASAAIMKAPAAVRHVTLDGSVPCVLR